MKSYNTSLLTIEQRREMDEFMRPQSQLVSFAKSLRMEGEGGGSESNPDPSKQQTADDAQKIVDHFKDIDLDELPENIRTAVSNAKTTIDKLNTTAAQAEQRRGQAENFARQKQSEADRLRGVLQHHKLADGPTPKGNLSGDKMAARIARLEAKGIKPEAAKVYAEMFEGELAAQEQELLQRFAPLAGAVGDVQAQQVLQAAELQHSELFAIPEVAKAVRENVKVMVSQGNSVNPQSISHLLEMAYGHYAMNHPDKIGKGGEVPNLKGGGGMTTGGSHRSNVDAPADGKPVARQPETNGIIAAINAQMVKDLPKFVKKA